MLRNEAVAKADVVGRVGVLGAVRGEPVTPTDPALPNGPVAPAKLMVGVGLAVGVGGVDIWDVVDAIAAVKDDDAPVMFARSSRFEDVTVTRSGISWNMSLKLIPLERPLAT